MTQQEADALAAELGAIRDQFLSPKQIAALYGVSFNAVQKYANRARNGDATLIHIVDPSGTTLIPKEEAERVWGRWQGRR